MEVGGVVERVGRIAATRSCANSGAATIESALTAEREVRAWLDASNADLVSSLAEQSSFPEAAIAETSKGSLGAAGKRLERSQTLHEVPSFADALDDGAITAGHVDAITRAGKGLDDDQQRTELHERVAKLVDVASAATEAEFDRRVRDEARRIRTDDGIDRLEGQRRSTSLRSWVDREGMWNLRGRFDPVSGVRIASALDGAVETLFAEAIPETAPTDPVEKQAHLRALALDRLVTGTCARRGSGRPEFVVVIDAGQPDTDGHSENAAPRGAPHVDWPLPVEVPWPVLVELAGGAEIQSVVVRNGIVIHAPGHLNLGRTTRLANRAQRRALRGLYSTCAIPGCTTHYDRCKLHHVIWWRHGGRTDLDNLLPLCSHHHHKVHDHGWHLALGPNRELTLTLPDGDVRNTGPPSRKAA